MKNFSPLLALVYIGVRPARLVEVCELRRLAHLLPALAAALPANVFQNTVMTYLTDTLKMR